MDSETIIESSFEYTDGKMYRTIKVTMPPCDTNDDAAWAERNDLAERIRALLQAPAQPAQVQGWQMVMPPSPYCPELREEMLTDYEIGELQGRCDMWEEVKRLNAASPKPPVCPKCFDITGCPSCEPKPPVQGWMLVPADLIDNFPEINPNNYDHDQVCDLNDWGCDLVRAAIAAPQPSDDAKDAARYRWLLEQSGFGIRRNGVTELTVAFYEVQPDNIGQLSFAIDAAMAGGGE